VGRPTRWLKIKLQQTKIVDMFVMNNDYKLYFQTSTKRTVSLGLYHENFGLFTLQATVVYKFDSHCNYGVLEARLIFGKFYYYKTTTK